MSHFQRRVALFKNQAFTAYVLGQLFSAIGNGLGYIAMSWVVISKHNSVSAMAILMACFWGPSVFLGPLMGVLADRLSRKWIITISNACRAIIFIAFSFYLITHFHVSTVYALMLCIGISFSAFFSSVFAFMRELVAENNLMHAYVTIDIVYEIGNLAGMGLAGFLIAWTSPETVILMNGLTFLIAVLLMFFVPKAALCHGGPRTKQKIKVLQDFRDGLNYLAQNKKLIGVYTIQLLIFITYLSAPLLLLPFSQTILHASAKQFGMIEASASLGIVIGGLIVPWVSEQLGLFRTLMIFCSVLFLTFLYFGYNHSIPLAAIMYFMIGFSGAVWPLIITRAQSLTTLDFQGRVQSTFNSLSGAAMLIFYFGIGSVGKYIGVEHLYFAEVIIITVAIVLMIKMRGAFSEKIEASV
ncbi:MAG: hypothetical protein ACD_42C00090G0004 [uncultured bacterium]|nr:MAG: hypothetical protein ACD_42C00090G0004 [uncultured bacterium]OGT26217.1 MAG: hypothetical protein A3B71_06825 [Gammaproteobacteria bacterium RIFCSPHIGHO2_02_FULL_42_43]OGT28518.1 MAG: hypothetical protein A2624_00900 [Gammaproteobacteria bacterium RIFCSPHIGHO2_01_FULL_42_8]OGT52594.1 MAG: hypothetical protein A3E54_06425 [Gammaproteobacteria bacterium RIFCSPHIGHO2_12_FULL_41_25]OGT63192.1 MAG: hypothetical protein A3I77_06230 [Gammaproteobacteria bacterium RIFCSPLOWO2_02_FULL_42_14]OGT